MAAVIKLSSPATREYWEIPVLYEDDYLLALDKPSGLLTSPDRYDPARPNLMKLLHAGIAAQKPWARERNLAYLSNAHRLDFETSGVILLAKTKAVLVALADLFGSIGKCSESDGSEIGLAQHDSRIGRRRDDRSGCMRRITD